MVYWIFLYGSCVLVFIEIHNNLLTIEYGFNWIRLCTFWILHGTLYHLVIALSLFYKLYIISLSLSFCLSLSLSLFFYLVFVCIRKHEKNNINRLTLGWINTFNLVCSLSHNRNWITNSLYLSLNSIWNTNKQKNNHRYPIKSRISANTHTFKVHFQRVFGKLIVLLFNGKFINHLWKMVHPIANCRRRRRRRHRHHRVCAFHV